eukprot:696025-Rhodomonas_salina.1
MYPDPGIMMLPVQKQKPRWASKGKGLGIPGVNPCVIAYAYPGTGSPRLYRPGGPRSRAPPLVARGSPGPGHAGYPPAVPGAVPGHPGRHSYTCIRHSKCMHWHLVIMIALASSAAPFALPQAALYLGTRYPGTRYPGTPGYP